jgi:hypothetical protein
MLELLCKKDDFWRRVAFNICKDKTLADDLVQEMYIKLSDCTKEINDFYVIITIKNIFLNHLKKESLITNGMNSISAITYQVMNGKNGMPAFGGRLKEEDIIEVSVYILYKSTK